MIIKYDISSTVCSMKSVGKHAFSDGSWKYWGTLMSSTPLFRNEILQILEGAFL